MQGNNRMMVEHPADEILSAYADGELEPANATQVTAHLEKCLTCRRHLEEWRELGAATRAAAGLKRWPEEIFRRELLDRLTATHAYKWEEGLFSGRSRRQVGKRARLNLRMAAAAGAVVLLLAGAGLGWARSSYDRYLEKETSYLVREHQAVRLGVIGSPQFASFSEDGGRP